MSELLFLALADDSYTTIQVQFPSSPKLYTYKLKKDLVRHVKVDGFVVVDSPSTGFTVVKVKHIDDKPVIDIKAGYSYKWVVTPVYEEEYRETLAREKEFVESVKHLDNAAQRKNFIDGVMSRAEELGDKGDLCDALDIALGKSGNESFRKRYMPAHEAGWARDAAKLDAVAKDSSKYK